MINAHGGKLVNRVTEADPSGLLSIDISADLANDVENIADGIFSPLEGFLNKQDFESVISKGRLTNNIAWTIPTVLDVDDETGKKMKEAGDVLLKNPDGTGIAILHVEDVFSFDKSKNAILALLKTQKSTKNILSTSNLIRDNLNSTNKITDYKAITFNLSLNSDDVDSRIKKTIFGSNILNEYKSIKMDNGDYLIYIIDSIEYPKNLKEVYTKDNEFSNFITNTRSESEYTLFQQALKANVKIDINEDYLNSD